MWWRKLGKWGELCLFFILGLSLMATRGEAQDRLVLVGSVIDIDGPSLSTNRSTEEQWFQAYPQMKTYLDERLRSDEETTATIEFLVGGRAVISPGSEIEISSPKDTTILKLKSGALWASFDKQDKSFQIETSGGVIGIEGTEFLVELSDDGETELTVIEGELSVSDAEGEQAMVSAGEQALFSRRRALRLSRFAAQGLSRQEARNLTFGLPGKRKRMLRPAIQRAVLQRSPSHRRLLRGMFIAQPESLEALLLALAQARPAAEQGRRAASRPRRRPDWAPMTFSQSEGSVNPLDLSWTKVRGAHGYVAVLTEDVLGRELVWYGFSKQNRLAYPKNGPELREGERYHLFVVPVAVSGKPIGRNPVAHLGFLSPGHNPTFETLPPVKVELSKSSPRLHWETCPGALSYGITIRSSENDIVWTDETRLHSYPYPARARALKPGKYSAVVEAFDMTGLKVGESPSAAFTIAR